MSTTILDLGPVRPVHKGAWSNTATYELLNIVTYNGGSWMMVGTAAYTVGTTPAEGSTWALIAEKGSDATVPEATTSVVGKARFATASEVATGTSTTTMLSPSTGADIASTGRTITGSVTVTGSLVSNTSLATPALILDGWTITVEQ